MGGSYERISTEVDVEQGSLRALKQNLLASLVSLESNNGSVRHVLRKLLAIALVFLIDSVQVACLAAVNLCDDKVLQLAGFLDLLLQHLGVYQVVHADTDTLVLVGVAGADSSAGGADIHAGLLGLKFLGQLVEKSVPRHDDVCTRVNTQIIAGNAALIHALYFFKKYGRVNHNAAADKAESFGVQDSGGEQVELVNLVAVNYGVTSVVSAAGTYYDISLRSHDVDDLSLALVAPLGSDNYT